MGEAVSGGKNGDHKKRGAGVQPFYRIERRLQRGDKAASLHSEKRKEPLRRGGEKRRRAKTVDAPQTRERK